MRVVFIRCMKMNAFISHINDSLIKDDSIIFINTARYEIEDYEV